MALHKDVRRQRAFEEFKRRLDGMSPDEVRTMLEQRRIRSPERVELAEARLQQHGKAAGGAKAEAAVRARRRSSDEGRDPSRVSEAPEAAAGAAAGGGEEVPVARQVGRMLGIGLGIASIAALAVFASRR